MCGIGEFFALRTVTSHVVDDMQAALAPRGPVRHAKLWERNGLRHARPMLRAVEAGPPQNSALVGVLLAWVAQPTDTSAAAVRQGLYTWVPEYSAPPSSGLKLTADVSAIRSRFRQL